MLEKAKTLALCALVILTLTMSIRDQLPATQDDIVGAMASLHHLPAAAAALQRNLVLQPHPTKAALRRMRAEVLDETTRTATSDESLSSEARNRLAILVGLTSCVVLVALRILVRRLQRRWNTTAARKCNKPPSRLSNKDR
ncbi:hypothetical protein A2G96_12910 [Cupriavidus nantongensis]|uniref:Uncharacterized protein n=1 Tax=Cupriavidus nantongensis TaxID=1796606 RepID=A0A142JKF6_9BURK|nr:hypothetical protein A2G96_12910 [Cupriavidus nantongensis]